jgi:outer membrane protein assembly factor BamB
MQRNCLFIVFFLFLITYFLSLPATTPVSAQTSSDWYMAGANPQRTGWSTTSVGAGSVVWYRPIEAYIDQKVQLIAAGGMIFVSTSRGLVALDAANGSLRWRYDTQLPLGHSPTVDTTQNPHILYVGGLDKKLHALNAATGQLLWTYSNTAAGFSTNPLVVENKVILGNRDGAVYAVNKQGSANAGQLAWKFQTSGPVLFSPAYINGRVYVASNDNHAYAINSSNGTQVWRSSKLPGDGFHSYYPVIYRDKVIFPTTYIKGGHVANEFRMRNAGGGVYEPYFEGDPLASGDGGLIGTVEGPTSWSNGWHTLYPWRVLEHFENNPNSTDVLFHKPEERPLIVLNQSDGREFTFDSDGDGHPEYVPFSFWRGHGTNYPPIVDLNDQMLYSTNPIACCSDAKGKLYGWNINYPSRVAIVGANSNVSPQTIGQGGGWAAMAEPQSFSGGGTSIYRSLCCDRVGDRFNSITPAGTNQYWSYNLGGQIPGYDFLWQISPVSISRHQGWYKGNYNTGTGVYHSHGDQAPLIPYNGRVYVHRSNVIIAYGTGTSLGQLPIIPATQPNQSLIIPSETELKNRLNTEIQKIVDVNGHLRPGWLSANLHNYGSNREGFEDYFDNPGDTLFTLSYAYPHLSSSLQTQVASYLSQKLIPDFFDTDPNSNNPVMYAKMGYADRPPREWLDIPPDFLATFRPQTPSTSPGAWSFSYPQHNFYALYLYAKNVPGVNAGRMYTLAKSKLKVPTGLSTDVETTTFTQDPFEHNAWITGYHGFLKLQELAGMQTADATLRNNVIAEHTRLVNLRASLFNKETAWVDLDANTAVNAKKSLDIARNFMFLSPELAQDYRNNSQLFQKAQDALSMYENIAAFWFVGKYESMPGESSFQNLYSQPALFQAKAWILRQPRQELYKYLDTPMFARGDLFYIQNLVTTIEAPLDSTIPTSTQSPSSPTPTPIPGDANGDGRVDGLDYVIWLNNYGITNATGPSQGDFNSDARVDGLDYVVWLNNYGT